MKTGFQATMLEHVAGYYRSQMDLPKHGLTASVVLQFVAGMMLQRRQAAKEAAWFVIEYSRTGVSLNDSFEM